MFQVKIVTIETLQKKQTSNIDSQGYHKKADSWIDEIKDSVMQKHDRYRKKGY